MFSVTCTYPDIQEVVLYLLTYNEYTVRIEGGFNRSERRNVASINIISSTFHYCCCDKSECERRHEFITCNLEFCSVV